MEKLGIDKDQKLNAKQLIDAARAFIARKYARHVCIYLEKTVYVDTIVDEMIVVNYSFGERKTVFEVSVSPATGTGSRQKVV